MAVTPAEARANAAAPEGAQAAPALRVTGLSKRFGGLVAVDGLSFDVHAGEVLGLLGPNGSGKTTSLNLISGALPADAGEVHVEGAAVHRLPAWARVRAGVVRTFQLVRVAPGMTVAENVTMGLVFGRRALPLAAARERARALAETMGLGAFVDRPAAELTYIDLKRVEFARALALEPRVLLLDEWLAGLNPSELAEAIDLVRSVCAGGGPALVLVEHVMEAVRALCHRCVVMVSGRMVAEGAPDAVLAHPEVVRAYLGDEGA